MTGEELASYYRAAIEFIDPRLGEDCPVEDICAAAMARQRALAAHQGEPARIECAQIDEALRFIERVHPALYCNYPADRPAEPAACAVVEDSAPVELPEAVLEPVVEITEVEDSLQLTVVEELLPEPAALPADEHPEPTAVSTEPAMESLPAAQLHTITDEELAEEEIIELVITRPEPELAVSELAEPVSAEISTSEIPCLAEVCETACETELDEHLTEPEIFDVEPEPVSELESAEQEEVIDEPVAAAIAAEEADIEAEVLESIEPELPEPAIIGRRQFIADLQERREQAQPLLAEAETAQLLAELQPDIEASERVNAILERIPDVETLLERELQQEESASQPLDFRGMIARAQRTNSPPSRPAALRKVRTEEIMQHSAPAYRIPEESAAPVLLGLLLIFWQFSSALLAGFAACRLLAWPLGTAFAALTPIRAVLACLLAVGIAALTGMWFRHYRLRTHRLALPVHLTALSILLLLLPWQLNSAANAYAVGPPLFLWGLFIAAWLVATVACWFHDLRLPPLPTPVADPAAVAKSALAITAELPVRKPAITQ